MDKNAQLGDYAKQEGIKRAIAHANRRVFGWEVSAFNILVNYIKENKTFKAEDIRNHAESLGLELPPDKRAWGAIILRAKKVGLIRHIGYTQVDNPKAHKTNVSIWERIE